MRIAERALLAFLMVVSRSPVAAQGHLATAAQYSKYIDPLLAEPDFGIEYTDEGSAGATVLSPAAKPGESRAPRRSVMALVLLRARAVPLLIDCLADGRVTSLHFKTKKSAKPVNVPVGYVCLDILTHVVEKPSVSAQDCADEGPGACVQGGFYFGPADYYGCVSSQEKSVCRLRPWIRIVQQNWIRQLMNNSLRFHDPPGYPPLTAG
jgi:hypothetical protein